MQQRRIGAHLSVAKGLVTAGEAMLAMGGNCLQIFSGSPRGWARKPIAQVDGTLFTTFCKVHDFGPVFIHALYLVNLTGESDQLITHSIDSLTYDLAYGAAIGARGVIVHLGSHLGKGFDAVFHPLIARLKTILAATPKNSTLLIENSAGQKGKLCSDFGEIRRIFDALPGEVQSGRLGWCLDTCHAFAAGYSLGNIQEPIAKHQLQKQLKVIHLNDAKDPFDSGRDRHENIGEGTIGRETLQQFLTNPAWIHLPVILEVPGFDKKGPDAKNIAIVKELVGEQ